jgi:hypothetical protein
MLITKTLLLLNINIEINPIFINKQFNIKVPKGASILINLRMKVIKYEHHH